MIDSHIHLHPLSSFDKRSVEEISDLYEEFLRYVYENSGIEIGAAGTIVLLNQELPKITGLRHYYGVYINNMQDLERDLKKYNFWKFPDVLFLCFVAPTGYLTKAKRIQVHSPYNFDMFKTMIEVLKDNTKGVKIYLAHGAYLFSEPSDEIFEQLVDLVKENNIFIGISPPNNVYEVDFHKQLVFRLLKSKELSRYVCLESDFTAIPSLYRNEYYYGIIEPALKNKYFRRAGRSNPRRFFE